MTERLNHANCRNDPGLPIQTLARVVGALLTMHSPAAQKFALLPLRRKVARGIDCVAHLNHGGLAVELLRQAGHAVARMGEALDEVRDLGVDGVGASLASGGDADEHVARPELRHGHRLLREGTSGVGDGLHRHGFEMSLTVRSKIRWTGHRELSWFRMGRVIRSGKGYVDPVRGDGARNERLNRLKFGASHS